jgi:hypothetical protein
MRCSGRANRVVVVAKADGQFHEAWLSLERCLVREPLWIPDRTDVALAGSQAAPRAPNGVAAIRL